MNDDFEMAEFLRQEEGLIDDWESLFPRMSGSLAEKVDRRLLLRQRTSDSRSQKIEPQERKQ